MSIPDSPNLDSLPLTVPPTTQNPDYAGMTINERLFAAGIMDHFDHAAKDRNGEEMIRILMQVALDEKDARWTTEAILANPKNYGY